MISYNNNDTTYRFTHRRKINRWLKESAAAEGFKLLSVNIIFCSARRLLELNNEYLNHDYFTDIITFDYSDLDEGFISGELFIDVETVADNAAIYGVEALREMHRVLIHGVMHLCGYGDKSQGEAAVMRSKENHYLGLLDAME